MPEVTIENKKKNINSKTVRDLLSQLSINPETVLVTKDKEILTEQAKLTQRDKIKIIKITSQG